MKRLQNRRTRMTKASVLETRRKTSKVIGRGEHIEITEAITSHEINPCLKVKYRETKWVKRHKNIIVSSELSHRNQIFNNLWCVKHF